MTITQPQAFAGISATGTPASSRTSGSVSIGSGQVSTPIPLATVAYTNSAKLAKSGNTLTLVPSTCAVTGTTATASTLVLGSGNSQVTYTSTVLGLDANAITITKILTDGITSSPVVSAAGFAVTILIGATTTATQEAAAITTWAGFLGAVAGGTGAGAVAACSATALTGATGTVLAGASAKDFEGVTIPTLAKLHALSIAVTAGSASASNGTQVFPLPATFAIPSGVTGSMLTGSLVITATADNTQIGLTVLGSV